MSTVSTDSVRPSQRPPVAGGQLRHPPRTPPLGTGTNAATASPSADANAAAPTQLPIAPIATAHPSLPSRDTGAAMLRGWRRRCPACGSAPLMKGYLTVRHECPACGEELMHHRADDGPAYLTILIVGHVMAPVLFLAFLLLRPEPLVLASVFSIGCVALSLYLLPRIKGAIVGLQWAKRLHGFGDK